MVIYHPAIFRPVVQELVTGHSCIDENGERFFFFNKDLYILGISVALIARPPY